MRGLFSSFGTAGRRRRAAAALAATALIGTGGLTATSGALAPADASPSGTLNWILDQLAWPTLDPALAAFRGTDQPISSLIYGNLFTVGPQNSYKPGLATSYKLSKDGLTFTMSLRSGVSFQDGTPFNAAAVKDSLTRDLDPANQCSCLSFLKPVTSITTPSATQVQLHFSSPDGTILAALSGSAASYIPSPTAVAKEGANFGNSPVGAGPFKVTQNAISQTLTLSNWPGYWDEKDVHVSQIHVTSEESGPSEWATLESGGAQMLNLPFGDPQVEQEAKRDSSLNVTSALGYAELVYLNPAQAPFTNLAARQAVLYATDSPAIARGLYFGLEPATEQLAGANQAGYPGNTLPGYEQFNLNKAKSLVKQLGGLSFTLNSGSTTSAVQLASELKQQWQEAGMNVTIAQLSATASIAASQAGNFQALLGAYSSQPDAVASLSNVIACPSLFNPKFCDKTINPIFVKAEGTPNLATQAKLMRQAEQLAVVKDAAFLPVVEIPEVSIADKSVKGLVVAGTQVYAAGVSL